MFDICVVSNNESFLLRLPVIYKIIINPEVAKIQNTEYAFLAIYIHFLCLVWLKCYSSLVILGLKQKINISILFALC